MNRRWKRSELNIYSVWWRGSFQAADWTDWTQTDSQQRSDSACRSGTWGWTWESFCSSALKVEQKGVRTDPEPGPMCWVWGRFTEPVGLRQTMSGQEASTWGQETQIISDATVQTFLSHARLSSHQVKVLVLSEYLVWRPQAWVLCAVHWCVCVLQVHSRRHQADREHLASVPSQAYLTPSSQTSGGSLLHSVLFTQTLTYTTDTDSHIP